MEQLTFDLINVKSQCDHLRWEVKPRALKPSQHRRDSGVGKEKLISNEIKSKKLTIFHNVGMTAYKSFYYRLNIHQYMYMYK